MVVQDVGLKKETDLTRPRSSWTYPRPRQARVRIYFCQTVPTGNAKQKKMRIELKYQTRKRKQGTRKTVYKMDYWLTVGPALCPGEKLMSSNPGAELPESSNPGPAKFWKGNKTISD